MSFLDIDECQRGIADCQQICINTIGGFNCGCEFGYTLDDVDRKTCGIGIQLNSVKCWWDWFEHSFKHFIPNLINQIKTLVMNKVNLVDLSI